jgi:hypothetical protein
MHRMWREVLFVRDERAGRLHACSLFVYFLLCSSIYYFRGPQNSQNQSQQFESQQFESQQFESQAHPIEGTLAGLNSRFYLDQHAR